jgi:hypothetical protein
MSLSLTSSDCVPSERASILFSSAFIGLLFANSHHVFLDTLLQSVEMLTHLSLVCLCFSLTVPALHVMVTRMEALEWELVTGFL